MLFYITGKIADKTIIEYGFRSPFNLTDLRTAFANNNGGVYTDYYIYSIDETQVDAARIKNGDEFDAVWEEDSIVGLSFAKEDNYRILRFQVKDDTNQLNDTVTANGIDKLTIYVSVWNSDLLSIDNTFNETLLLPLTDPDKRNAYVKLTIVNGLASKEFKTTKYGIWNIPNNYKFKEYNLKTTSEIILDINALMDL
jgi:hypothetical protein